MSLIRFSTIQRRWWEASQEPRPARAGSRGLAKRHDGGMCPRSPARALTDALRRPGRAPTRVAHACRRSGGSWRWYCRWRPLAGPRKLWRQASCWWGLETAPAVHQHGPGLPPPVPLCWSRRPRLRCRWWRRSLLGLRVRPTRVGDWTYVSWLTVTSPNYYSYCILQHWTNFLHAGLSFSYCSS